MHRVVITGASGLLGRAIFRQFNEDPNWDAVGVAFSRAGDKYRKVDLTNRAEIHKLMQEVKPEIIIHAAAERRPDIVENKPDETKSLNEMATQYLCEEANHIGAWLMYMSTDYVFDGKDPPYQVYDTTNPLNKYGISKLAGENVTLYTNADNGVLRVPILYGPVEDLPESAVTILFGAVVDTSKPCTMSDYERRFPTHVDDVAAVIKFMAGNRLKNPQDMTGIFQWSNNENMTKYDMSLAMAQCFNLPTNHITADKHPSKGAPRPYNTQLDCSRLESMGAHHRTPFKEGIKSCLQTYYERLCGKNEQKHS